MGLEEDFQAAAAEATNNLPDTVRNQECMPYAFRLQPVPVSSSLHHCSLSLQFYCSKCDVVLFHLQLSNDEKLDLYALFKQASVGDINTCKSNDQGIAVSNCETNFPRSCSPQFHLFSKMVFRFPYGIYQLHSPLHNTMHVLLNETWVTGVALGCEE